MSLKGNLNVSGKILTSTKLILFRQKKHVIKIDKDRNESIVTISYKIKFIDSARFMMSSLSNLVDNLAEGIHKTKCKGCASFLEHKCINDNLINYNCLFFNQKLLKQG